MSKVLRDDLSNYLDELLSTEQFADRDYCPNGLQIQGKSSIRKIVTGVTASQALIVAAIENQADALLVHHGYFWRGESPCLTSVKYVRVRTLLMHDINLFAYHLPLDMHDIYGNNVKLGELLGFQIHQHGRSDADGFLGCLGSLVEAQNNQVFAKHIMNCLGREPLFIQGNDRPIKTLAWCTGAAQDFIEQAAAREVDAYISGEVSERTYHLAKELGVNYFAAGHHATERYGVQALGENLKERFGIEHQFINIDNPV